MKTKFKREEAMVVAEQMVKELKPFCERIEIAGSLRRGKNSVGDVEILFVSKNGQRAKDLFTQEDYSLAGQQLDGLCASGVLTKRPNKNGVLAWGYQNKLAVHAASGIPVDFFETTIENWYVSLVIRTGSKETNLRLTTGAQNRGCTLHAYGSGVEDRITGAMRAALSEQEVFAACGIPYLNPTER